MASAQVSTPRVAAALTVLAGNDLLSLICMYQSGIPNDMCPLNAVQDYSCTSNNVDTLDAAVGGWIESHGTPRLPLLFTVLPKTRRLVAEYAACRGRVDVLAFLHTNNDLPACSQRLLEVAVLEGENMAAVEFLSQVGYRLSVTQTAFRASSRRQWPVLGCLLRCFPAELWSSLVADVARRGCLEGLQSLLAAWPPTPDMRSHVRQVCLEQSLDHVKVSRWLAQQLQGDDDVIFNTFVRHPKHITLLEYVAKEFILADQRMTTLVQRFPHDTVRSVFDLLFKPDTPTRIHAEKQCLMQATNQVSMTKQTYSIVRWLVFSSLDVSDVIQIIRTSPRGKNTMACAIRQMDLDMTRFLHDQGVPVNPRLVEIELLDKVNHIELALMLTVDECANPQQISFRGKTQAWVEWLVDQLGGSVAVMGHLLTRMACSNSLPTIFPKVYTRWMAQVNDANEKSRVQMACVQGGHAKAVDCVVRLADVSLDLQQLLFHAVEFNSLGLAQRIHKGATKGMTQEEKRHIADEMHLVATAAGRIKVLQWLAEEEQEYESTRDVASVDLYELNSLLDQNYDDLDNLSN
ncbi:Aste57867_3002 [Aphanomyces stellatus]|uniref:Aste57867_3002 protein n=1 Tax=Aphanomyces stellatus TaxID=120398 RepID=A0A485KE20_9STRA|nr:hypothetical protein As57867_002993 [Aphanomyces stellatus]VFT80183.1 Aste57867_3002 [Aphanomyces stellatus]